MHRAAGFHIWGLVDLINHTPARNVEDLLIKFDEFIERYELFGGIIQNVLGEDNDARFKLKSCLKGIDFEILTSIALNVDEGNLDRNRVSGYLVCYNHRWDEGNDDFSMKNLEYTSLAVEGAVVDKLCVLSTNKQMKAVLCRLDRELVDLSGKMLENAVVFM